jgi:hypothetical protein
MTEITPSLLEKKLIFKRFKLLKLICFSHFSWVYVGKNIIENVVGNINMKFFGNIRVHKYYCFQKRLGILGLTNNLLPITEMFLIRPELLDEKNFELFLNILKTIINSRKHNMKYLLENPFFQILSLFFEKYPKNIFTEKILERRKSWEHMNQDQ